MSIAASPHCDEAGRPQFNLKLLLTALTLTAVISALSPWIDGKSHIIISIYALTFLFGCHKTRRAVVFMLPALYLPFAWQLLASDAPQAAMASFGYWPGQSLLTFLQSNNFFGGDMLAVLLTLGMFFAAVMCGRGSSRAAAISSLNLLCVSWLCSMISLAA